MRGLSSLHVLLLFVLAVAGLAACKRRPGAAAADADPAVARFRTVSDTTVGYVGDAACATCHADIARTYQTHAMARGFHRPETDSLPETFPSPAITHEASGYTYRAYREGTDLFQEETRADDPAHRVVRKVAYVIGSGNAARTYLSESNGRLYQLPLTWYNQRGVWDFSPGYEIGNQRFTRIVPDRCIACHNAYPEVEPFTSNKFTSLASGISCERCHGPGEEHVAARQQGPATDSVDVTIVNPKHLPIGRRLDVCQQCHLHGGVELLRDGRGPFSFRPGEALDAHLALFVLDAPEQEGRIPVSSHAERMQRSACFKGGQMDCATCHDPHSGEKENDAAHFNQTCQTCHPNAALVAKVSAAQRANHTPASACTNCHMPRTEAVDAPHSSFTDHFVRVVGGPKATLQEDTTAGAVRLRPWFGKDREGVPGRVYEGVAYIVYGRQNARRDAMETGIGKLQAALAETEGYDEARFLLGFALLRLGRAADAIAPLEAALRATPVPERLNTLAQAYEQTGRPAADAQKLYEQALTMQPALASIRVNLGRLLQAQGDLAGAAEQYRKAVEEQPWLAEAQYNLGSLLLMQGSTAAGQAALEAALALDPEDVQVRGNLGALYAQAGEGARARQQFEAAVRIAPNDPVALGNLGALLVNTGDPVRARPLLERAVEANPAYVDGLVNLALACGQTGDLACARRSIERAGQLAPTDPRLPPLQQALRQAQ